MSLFSSTVGNRPKKNAFNLSHERKLSAKMGYLYPILSEEILPGDSWRVNTEVMIRFAPMLAPIMHRVNVFTHYFFVPNRLIWDEWEDFITGGEDGDANPIRPYFTLPAAGGLSVLEAGTLADHLGFNTRTSNLTQATNFNALPFRAYQMIYNDYYRDQNLKEKIDFDITSGQCDYTKLVVLRSRTWEKDYFTSALPWTQRGGEVTLPLADSAPVYLTDLTRTQKIVDQYGDPVAGQSNQYVAHDNQGDLAGSTSQSIGAVVDRWLDPNGTMTADLQNASATTIEELRRATKLQQWLERNARGGSRYIDQILSHFGVISSDARLQRPEFLGGGKTPVVISEVLQTSSSDETTPQGNPAGHGIAVGNSNRIQKRFEEHGYIIGILSVLPKTAYQQGTRKHLLKNDKFDYYWPEFSQLGEQPILQAEIYDDYIDANRNQTFGYQSRYSEYKYIPSSVHGSFKTDLSFWHMGRIFSSAPALNNDFVSSTNDMSAINARVFAAGDAENQLWIQLYNNISALRPIPKFNNPSLL